MALNVAQYEEFCELLRRVPQLVDRLQARSPGFPEDVLQWLKQVEAALQNNRLAVVSQVAAARAALIGAARGVQSRDIVVSGRVTPRKLCDAAASIALERCGQLVHSAIADRQAVFQEAERIARQVMTVASAKGLVRACEAQATHQQFLHCLQQSVANDPDLVSAHAHLVSLVGKNDVLVFLDRALVGVA